jgi:hypothetical protein
MNMGKLRPGDWVEVKSKEEILRTLDRKGQLDGLPFMPQMFQFCGKRLRVYKRAHKSCDTVNKPGGLKMEGTVHLEGTRCDGQAYGGCQAECLLFWRVAWLKPSPEANAPGQVPAPRATGCTEAEVWAGTKADAGRDSSDPTYVCQATHLPLAGRPLPWWDLRQYVEDVTSGNVGIGRVLRGFIYSVYYNLSEAGIGLGRPMRWLYDAFQSMRGGIPFPRKFGTIPVGERTPTGALNLQPGELVRVKSHQEILATLNTQGKNRGLYFDAEAVPFCGGTYRVRSRLSRIVDEKTGKLVQLKNESVILEDVFCQARYSDCRMFCPRAIYSYWREIWLERVAEPAAAASKESEPIVKTS